MEAPNIHGPAGMDANLFNTWDATETAAPYVLSGHGDYGPTDDAIDAGPGAFVAPAILERGFNAWFGAPGYYVDAPGVDRVVPDQYMYDTNVNPPAIGANPWDHIFGTIGSYGVYDGEPVRDWPDQAGSYSLS